MYLFEVTIGKVIVTLCFLIFVSINRQEPLTIRLPTMLIEEFVFVVAGGLVFAPIAIRIIFSGLDQVFGMFYRCLIALRDDSFLDPPALLY